jgi:hypothetical protein
MLKKDIQQAAATNSRFRGLASSCPRKAGTMGGKSHAPLKRQERLARADDE